uniref:Ig-like domain-containing protein n=1 Tax=Hucho hucho TaxID=62062 RepID=A0A4W5PRM7_9TELE
MSLLLSREGNRAVTYNNMGQYRGSMGVTLLWILLWISRYGQGLSAEQLSKKIFFLAETNKRVTLQVSPAVPKGTVHQWMWTSHDGRHSNTSVARIPSSMNRKPSWNIQALFSQGTGYDLSIPQKIENAGEFVFMQTEPALAVLARFEVFGFVFKVTPNSNGNEVYLGSDVSVRCDVSSMPDGATLQWERDGDSISNTTLFYNKTAHMIIHNVDQNYRGRCNFRLNGKLLFIVYTTLNVQRDTFNKPLIRLFRESSNSSEVKLICRYSSTYRRAMWTMNRSTTSFTLTSSDKVGTDRFSSPPFNGIDFPLHVSPVKFEDSGRFTCFFDNQIFTLAELTTIRASGGPPGGQPVVLRCEVSEVSDDPVTLAWMRMEGSRWLLVKQDVLTKSHPNRTLSVTLPSLCRDQLHWQCVVFTEGMLRATASLTLTLPTQTTMSSMTDDNHLQTAVIVACIAMVVAGLLVGALVFYLKRKKTAVTNLPLTQKNDPVYDNTTDPRRDQESHKGQTGEDENEEVHYSEFALVEPRLDDHSRVTAGSNQVRIALY